MFGSQGLKSLYRDAPSHDYWFQATQKGVAKRAREADRSVSLFFCMLSPVQKLADRISKVFLEDEKL